MNGNHRQKDHCSWQPFGRQNICLPTKPEIGTAQSRRRWSAGDVDPRFSNLVPLHDFKHPRASPKTAHESL